MSWHAYRYQGAVPGNSSRCEVGLHQPAMASPNPVAMPGLEALLDVRFADASVSLGHRLTMIPGVTLTLHTVTSTLPI